MSKKKVASRSTMTLKDFHGGSIPSDLPLPSAPGMIVDRSAFERQSSGAWMSPTLGRGYGGDRGGYSRQGSASAVRTFDDKASYFPNPANIGRNYDEDERKPSDGRPRSSHSADRYDDHGYEERRGGFSMDRYSLEDQSGIASAPSGYGEARISAASDRFPPSQVVSGGFESDNYVHDEFGLIPVGPSGTRAQPRQQPSYQREVIKTPPEQPAYGQSPPASSLNVLYTPQPQPASSPPRSWRNPTAQQIPATGARPQQETASNVWTARREGELNRAAASEAASQNVSSTPWRPQSSAAKLSEASAVDKVTSGRWQSDATRPSGRIQGFLLTPGVRNDEPSTQTSSYGSDYVVQSPYSGEDGRGTQLVEDDTSRGGSVKRTTFSQVGRGEGFDRTGYSDERGAGRSAFQDGGVRSGYAADPGRHNYAEERWSSGGGYSEVERGSNVDTERISHPKSEINRVTYVESGRGARAENEGPETGVQTRPGYMDSSRYGFGSSVRGSSLYESGRTAYSDRGRYSDDGEVPVSAESEQVMYSENGRGSYAAESGTYSRDETRVGYGSDGNQVYGDRERSRSPYFIDRAGSVSPDIVGAGEVWRSGYSAPPSADATRTAQKTEPAERPKLKLLPRSKPIETINHSVGDVAGLEKGIESRYTEEKRPAEILSVENERSAASDLGYNSAIPEANEDRKVERPKLNLKPRTQVPESEPVEGSQKVRQVVFGGARPRELVLKERGVDDPLTVSEPGQTPSSGSLQSAAPTPSKTDRADIVRSDRQENWGEEKQEGRRYERPDRSFERQANKDGSREFERKDFRREQERVEGRRNADRYDNRRESDRTEPRRDGEGRRDIDKQDSWRRPAEPVGVSATSGGPRTPASTGSSLVDSTPRSLSGGKFGYSAPASAVELAQAFSRSTSIGSAMTGGASRGVNSSLRSPISPIPKGPAQDYGAGYGNGLPSPYAPRDAPFSRLAEAPPLPPVGGRETGGFGGDGYSNGSGGGKFGNSYGSASGRDRDEYDDFPGKRGLPIRQKEGYYD
ncbi:hypothetical protein R1flu_020464 [Riccia fluitans]|uniref:Uncharacterized protein n=1 Tax=Riccia fluitans TaxID=41844 RepID=A0ABD1ZLK6_9MARC